MFQDCCGACSSEVKAYWECGIKIATSADSCDFECSANDGSGALSLTPAGFSGMVVKLLLPATMLVI